MYKKLQGKEYQTNNASFVECQLPHKHLKVTKTKVL